jgi:hypothetical protein
VAAGDGSVLGIGALFFSPDSTHLGFWQAGSIKKVPISGGAPVLVSVVQDFPEGITWAANKMIYFGGIGSVRAVSENGGTVQTVITLDPAHRSYRPQLLPDGQTLLYTVRGSSGNWDTAEVVAQRLDGGAPKQIAIGADGRYLPTGHVVYALREKVLALAFDATSLRPVGTPVAVLDGVRGEAAAPMSQFTVSSDGTLAYVPSVEVPLLTLVWVHRDGREEPAAGAPADYHGLRLSPSGTRVALDLTRDGNRDIYMLELAGGEPLRITNHLRIEANPVWTPNDERLIFSSDQIGTGTALFWRPVDLSAAAELLLTGPGVTAYAMHGTSLFLSRRVEGGQGLITWVADLAGVPGRPLPLGEKDLTRFSQWSGGLTQSGSGASNVTVSHDGQRLAYHSTRNRGSPPEVFLYRGGEEFLVSAGGGVDPVFAPDGTELFYRTPDGAVMRAALLPGAPPGKPTQLIAAGKYSNAWNTYDIAKDGRFLMLKHSKAAPAAPDRIIVVQNWFDELRARVAGK